MASLLASAQLLPSIALACEGVTEEQKISITPIGGSAACPKNAKNEVEFSMLKEWCEYRIKNENKKEGVTIQAGKKNLPEGSECWTVGCLEFHSPPKFHTECVVLLKLAAGEECYNLLEYRKKPTAETTTGFDIVTKSTGGALGGAEVFQRLK